MFLNILRTIIFYSTFALSLINKAVNNVTNQCRYKGNKINKENKYEVRFIRHNEKSS